MKRNFIETEINKFEGLAASNRNPKLNQLTECINFDLRSDIEGDLIVRKGYDGYYDAPLSADHRGKLSSMTYLRSENLFIPDGAGKEITFWFYKATLNGETADGRPGINTRNILAIFSSHQFDGSSWVTKNWDGSTTGRYWLNHTVATSLYAVTTTHEVILAFKDAALIAANTFNNWTIINVSIPGGIYEVAQVIDTYDAGTDRVGLKITNNTIDWSMDDNIILMKNYIPYDSLIAMYDCTASDICFHKVLNDLKIGFGGQENRIGLSIGYRKKAFLINDIDWDGGAYDSFIEPLSSINNLIIGTYIPTLIDNEYLLELSPTSGSGNELAIGKYFFRMTGLLDNFNEILLVETSIVTSSLSDLIAKVKIKLGALNKRLTTICIYVAITEAITDKDATFPYYKLKEHILSADTYAAGNYIIDSEGYLTLPTTNVEIHTDHNAAINNVTDYAATGGSGSTGFFAGSGVFGVSVDTVSPKLGLRSIKVTNNSGYTKSDGCILRQASLLKQNINYAISFYAKSSIASQILSVVIKYDAGQVEYKTFTLDAVANTWGTIPFEYEFTAIKTINEIWFIANQLPNGETFNIDALSIMASAETTFSSLDIPASGVEMVSALGYAPTFDMVKSWDQAIVTQGKTFVVNPYTDKRYENKVFVSNISGDGALMYDVITANTYLDIEDFDGNNIVGIEKLQNLDFVVFRKNGIQIIDPNTNQVRGIFFMDGVISRRSIINFGDRIAWCGEDDIYVTDGLNVLNLTEGTIRDDYRSLTLNQKQSIIAIRENNGNAYRFFTGDTTTNIEFILTKKGWIKRVNYGTNYPDDYILAKNNSVWFVKAGSVYVDNTDGTGSDDGESIPTPKLKFAELDIELIGGDIKETDLFLVRSCWIDYTNHIESEMVILDAQIIVYMDGTAAHTETFTTLRKRDKHFLRLPPGITGRRIQIEFKLLDTGGSFVYSEHLSLHAIGILWTAIKLGIYN